MLYFDLKSDLHHMNSLLSKFERIVEIEKQTRERLRSHGTTYLTSAHMFRTIREESSGASPEYASLRATYAKMIHRAVSICEREGNAHHIQGRAALLEGGTPFSDSIFALILNRPSDVADFDTTLRDDANRLIGALEGKLAAERRRILNPFHWLTALMTAIVRLPYTIISVSGFDVSKIEEHLIGKAIHLLYVVALLLILVRLGLGSSVDLLKILQSAGSP